MAKNSLYVAFLLIFLSLPAYSQVNRYIVHFTDKQNNRFSIEQPEEFLSGRAIQRRQNHNIPIKENDLPVNDDYIKEVELSGAEVFYTSRWFNAVLVEAGPETIDSLNRLPFVAGTEFIAPGARLSSSNPKTGSSHNSKPRVQRLKISSDDQNRMLGVDDMHKQGFTGEGILIAVLDGGFENADSLSYFKHLFTDQNIKATYDFVENTRDVYRFTDHGTKVLSAIAAFAPESLTGTAYGADFILCVTEDVKGEYRIEEYNWVFAAEFADSAGADIINTSLGYTVFNDASMNYTLDDLDGKTALISRASSIAASKGILLVSSAGNEGNSASWGKISTPADADSIISVGAVDLEFNRAIFSSPGPTVDGRIKPEVSALGVGTVVGTTDGNFEQSNGTSFAAPLVTGLAAGIWQAYPELSNIEVIEKIKKSGSHAKVPNNQTGYGVPSFTRAQEGIILAVKENEDKTFKVFPNPVRSSSVCIETKKLASGHINEVRVYNSTGKIVSKNKITIDPRNNKFNLEINDLSPGVYIITILTPDTSESLKLIKF